MVSNWEPAPSLVVDAISGAKIAPCLPALAAVRLPLYLWWGEGPVHSQLGLLWCSLNPLFYERARLRIEPFMGKFSLIFFSPLAIPQFGFLSYVSSLRLSSGHSGPILTLNTNYAACAYLSSPTPWWQT